MSNVKLLPLPPTRLVINHEIGAISETAPFWNRRDMSDYALANVLHHTAPQPPAEAQAQGGGEVNMDVQVRDGTWVGTYAEWCRRKQIAPASAPAVVDWAICSLPALWRQREDNGEERTEFDKGYEQASDECADALEAALAAQPQGASHEASNVELLPLPEKLDFFLDGTGRQEAYNLTRDYARACVEASTEALRAEVERLKQMLGECYVEAGGDTDGNEPSRMYAQALSAVQDLRRDYDETLAEPDYKARAERLAEALREAQPVIGWTGTAAKENRNA